MRASSVAVLLLLLAWAAGCGGDDGDDNDVDRRPAPVAGTFVGKVRATDALVAVVAAPPAKGQDRREVTAFVCGRRVCASFAGTTTENGFVAKSGEGRGQARGRLSGKASTGSVELPDGRTVRYRAGKATAAAGLYDLTVSPKGRLRGASASGVALRGESKLPPPGGGTLRLADGTRLKFTVTRNTAPDSPRVRPGHLRLIVLPNGQLRGVGKGRRGGADRGADFFVRSTRG